jgi:signal transduction histidine kinase
MIKILRSVWHWLYHPVTVFLLTQVLWIFLMVVWIQWYIARYAQLRGIAEQFRTQAAVEGFTWIPLIVGAILLTLLLAGATVIFLYWNKQHRLNQTQRIFVSNVTHELKSPVASIQLALETMAMRRLSEGQKHEYLDMMLNDTERLSLLIDHILGAARIEKKRSRYDPQPLSMRRFVEEILGEDRHLFEKDGHVVVLEKGKDARVSVDRSAMRMVFGNLIENAARYSPRGSTIRLRIHPDLRSCRLDVIDAGVGIPRKDLKNIFKMFWRSGEAQSSLPRGTGLGLYIVRNIVSDHKGKVWATSPGPGRGSTFSVRLPRLRDSWNIRPRKKAGTTSANQI